MNFNGLLSNRERPVERDKKSSLQLLNRELNFEIPPPKNYNEWNIARIIPSRNLISLTVTYKISITNAEESPTLVT
jgi:hypothetical protein